MFTPVIIWSTESRDGQGAGQEDDALQLQTSCHIIDLTACVY